MVTYLVAWWITRSRFGRLLVAVRDDEDRVRFSGYDLALIKAVIFGISGAMAGIAGALFVPQVGIISPANLGIVPSIEMVIWVAVGGRGQPVRRRHRRAGRRLRPQLPQRGVPGHLAVLPRRAVHRRRRAVPDGIVGTVREGWDWLKARLGNLPGRGATAGAPAVGVMSHGD